MEFKFIIYFLIAIGWYVMKNYKKLAEENRKRTFGKPVEYPPVAEIPSSTFERRQNNEPKETSDVRTVKALKRRNEVKRKLRNELTAPDYDFFQSAVASGKIERNEKSEENVNITHTSVSIESGLLKNAIIYGEVINQPRWAKY
ncbi:MAG: hypothetical protein JSS90_09335 [Bacteroidetes bacterium]|nr:hypothetical protein [Bacteroidota bacterium]